MVPGRERHYAAAPRPIDPRALGGQGNGQPWPVAVEMDGDAWAPALLVTGPEEGLALAQRQGFEALLLIRRKNSLVEIGFGRFRQEASPRPTCGFRIFETAIRMKPRLAG
jgi:hypothetical protein